MNIEDFFRKKLNTIDSADDGWDKPDDKVWELAQQQIYATDHTQTSTSILKWLLVILLFLSVLYSLSLQKDLRELRSAIQASQQTTANDKDETPVYEITKKYQNLQANQLLLLKENKNLRKALAKHPYPLHNDLPVYPITKSTPLISSKSIVQKKLDKSTNEPKRNLLDSSISIPSLDMEPLNYETKDAPLSKIISNIKPSKKDFKKFEIGLQYSYIVSNIPSTKDYKDFDKTSNNSTSQIYNTSARGINLGYAPHSKLRLRTGIRQMSFITTLDQKEGLIYDKSMEYDKPNGGIGNNIELNAGNPYAQEKSNIGIDIPQELDIETGDLLILYMSESQKIRQYQIPLGIQYSVSDHKIRFQLEAGFVWNKMIFDEYILEVKAEAKNEYLEVDNITTELKTDSSKQYLSVYGGLGLNYELNSNWSLETSLLYNYDLVGYSSKAFSKKQLTRRSINIGLNYNF